MSSETFVTSIPCIKVRLPLIVRAAVVVIIW